MMVWLYRDPQKLAWWQRGKYPRSIEYDGRRYEDTGIVATHRGLIVRGYRPQP